MQIIPITIICANTDLNTMSTDVLNLIAPPEIHVEKGYCIPGECYIPDLKILEFTAFRSLYWPMSLGIQLDKCNDYRVCFNGLIYDCSTTAGANRLIREVTAKFNKELNNEH